MAMPATSLAKYKEVLQAIIDHHNTRLDGVDTMEWDAHLTVLTQRAAAYNTMVQYEGLLSTLPAE